MTVSRVTLAFVLLSSTHAWANEGPKPCAVVVRGGEVTINNKAIEPGNAAATCPHGAQVTGDHEGNRAWIPYRDAFRRGNVTIIEPVTPIDVAAVLDSQYVSGSRVTMPGADADAVTDYFGTFAIVGYRAPWWARIEQPVAMFDASRQSPPSGFRNLRLALGRQETLGDVDLRSGVWVTVPTAVRGGAPRDAGIAAELAARTSLHERIGAGIVVRAGYNDDWLQLARLNARYIDLAGTAQVHATDNVAIATTIGLMQLYGDTKQLAPHIEVAGYFKDARLSNNAKRELAVTLVAVQENDQTTVVVGLRGSFRANLLATRAR